MKTTGEKIRACREEKGLTQEELGKKTGQGRSYIANVEANRKNPGLNVISKFANALDVHPVSLLPDWFLFGGYE